VVKVAISWSGELQGAEVDVVKCFVINAERFIRVLHELMNGKGGVIRLNTAIKDTLNWEIKNTHLNDCVRNLRTRDNGICAHHPIGVLFANFRDKEGTHTGTSATSEGVGDLEA
jgi:hypothetical protein